MSSTTLSLTVSFALFAMVNSGLPPYITQNEYKFICQSVCSEYLKGDTFSCWVASGFGLAGGGVVIRILSNFDWRTYGIRGGENTKEFCTSILAADQFYSNGNKTYCNPLYHQHDLYYDGTGFRSSGAKRKVDDTRMEKLVGFTEEITKLAKEIQKEALMSDDDETSSQDDADVSSNKRSELSDARIKRILPVIGSMATNVLGIAGIIDTDNKYNYPNINPIYIPQTPRPLVEGMDGLLQNEQYIGTPYSLGSHHNDLDDRLSGVGKTPIKSNNAIIDSLCLWASEHMCYTRQMVTCVQDVCCWKELKSGACNEIHRDRGINKHRENVFQIIQATRAY